VRALPIRQGSVLSDFSVVLTEMALLGGASVGAATATKVLYDVYKRTLDRNLGNKLEPETDILAELEIDKSGDLEALASATEPAFRRAHSAIGAGVNVANVYGGKDKVAVFDEDSKRYVNGNIEDDTMRSKHVSVASFNVNQGTGGVFDPDLGRIVTFKVNDQSLVNTRSILSWGIDQYANRTGRKVNIDYTTIVSFDGRPKKYIILGATITS
jgi:hypothetical protein